MNGYRTLVLMVGVLGSGSALSACTAVHHDPRTAAPARAPSRYVTRLYVGNREDTKFVERNLQDFQEVNRDAMLELAQAGFFADNPSTTSDAPSVQDTEKIRDLLNQILHSKTNLMTELCMKPKAFDHDLKYFIAQVWCKDHPYQVWGEEAGGFSSLDALKGCLWRMHRMRFFKEPRRVKRAASPAGQLPEGPEQIFKEPRRVKRAASPAGQLPEGPEQKKRRRGISSARP